MQTQFTATQLADPEIHTADGILRSCVHCGFCTATCPTYVLLGDERDSPRGRIYLMKGMLEAGGPPDPAIVPHIDRCLSCLACMTTCPSGVHYMHLVDHARRHIEETHHRPLAERWQRRLLATVLPDPRLFRLSLWGAALARPFARVLPPRLRAMIALAPRRIPGSSQLERPQVVPAEGTRRRRVALLTGCVQHALAPRFNEATIRLLTRHGCEVVLAKGAGCCGALAHHLGRHRPAVAAARANIDAWTSEIERNGLDTIVINASGCGTMVKDYGHLFRNDSEWSERAAAVAGLAMDVSELMAELGLDGVGPVPKLRIAYQSACSLQHGQNVEQAPRRLLSEAGFDLATVAESHLCCGSAGTYNILQPKLAEQLLARKCANLERSQPQAIATGNVGCATHLARGTRIPIVHTVELLDWATGGPQPEALAAVDADRRA